METKNRKNGNFEGVNFYPKEETYFAVDGRVIFKYNPKKGILERNEDFFPEKILGEMFASLVMTREKDYTLEMEPFGKVFLEDIRNYGNLKRNEMYVKDPSLKSSTQNVVHYMTEEYRNRTLGERIRDSFIVA